MIPSENQVTERLSQILAELTGARPKVRRWPSGHPAFDFVVQIDSYTFLVERRPSGATDAVAPGIARAAEAVEGGLARLEFFKKNVHSADRFIPVIAVPYMGEVGKLLCEKAGVGWIDLCGNARLVAPGLRVRIEGRPNQFKQAGRPLDAFAPKSSRITRYLLTHLGAHSIRSLARETGMDPGFTSRIVHRLEVQGFLHRVASRSNASQADSDIIAVRDRQLLIDAWRATYDFFRHDIIRGHVAARTSEELVRDADRTLREAGVEYAATGLGAAALYTGFLAFRLVTFYLHQRPSEGLKHELGFHEDPKGANVWLTVPNDDGVFDGAKEVKGIRCVHPLQVYLDLKDHPERSAEAADELRDRFLR